MKLLGVYGHYSTQNGDLQNFSPIEFLEANIAAIGGKMIEGVPAPTIRICDIDHLREYEGDSSSFKCLFGSARGRLQVRGKKAQPLKDLVVIDKEKLWGIFTRMDILEYRLSACWVITLMILRLFYSTRRLRREALIPLPLLKGICSDEGYMIQQEALFNHYKYSNRKRREKDRELIFRRNIDKTIVGIGAASQIINVWKDGKEWNEEEILVILRSKRDNWSLAKVAEESRLHAA